MLQMSKVYSFLLFLFQVGCKFHWDHDVVMRKMKLPVHMRDAFETECYKLSNSKTIWEFETVLDRFRVSAVSSIVFVSAAVSRVMCVMIVIAGFHS